MGNPASELLEIFQAWRNSSAPSNAGRRKMSEGESGHQDHIRAMTLLGAVGREIDRLETAGRRVTAYRNAFPRWVEGTLAFRSNWTSKTNADTDFPDEALETLEMLADVLDNDASTPLAPQALALLNDLLGEVLDASTSDESLDDALALYIRSAVRHLQTCLDEYETVGKSATMLAFQGVWVATRAAAAVSKDPSLWEKLRDRLFYPTAGGLLANAPSLALQLESLG